MIGMLTGWKGYVAVAGLSGVLAGIVAWQWQANAYERQIAQNNERQAMAELGEARAALTDLQAATTTINQKAIELRGIQFTLGGQLDAIRKEMKNAKPLPVDCRPDDFRVRKLFDAVAAAQQAATAR